MKKQLALLLLSLLLSAGAALAQDPTATVAVDDAPIKIDTLLLTVPLTVSDKNGHNVPGLKKENFTVFQDGQRQPIEFFFNEEAPMNVAILLDTSFSSRPVLEKIQKAAREFIKVFRPEDRGIIVSFDYRTTFLSDLTADRKKLSKAIGEVQIADRSGSDLYDAISLVTKKQFASFKGRKAIIVLSDGMVGGKNFSAQQVLDILRESDTVFYPIIFKTEFYSDERLETQNKSKPLPIEMLRFLSEETTGRFYEKNAANLNEAFQNIAQELKKQYLIGFYPQNTAQGKAIGHIRIGVDQKDLTIGLKKTHF
jgi:VWFA-related protein